MDPGFCRAQSWTPSVSRRIDGGICGARRYDVGTLAWHPLRRLEATVPAEVEVANDTVPVRVPIRDVNAVVDPLPVVRQSRSPKVTPEVEEDDEDVPLSRPIIPTDDALPPLDLLTQSPPAVNAAADEAELIRLGDLLLATLKTFKVEGTLAGITSGPSVSQFEVVPAAGVKAGRIVALADDLAITMRAHSLRVAPIPGRGAVGVEIANPNPRTVTIRELLSSEAWRQSPAILPVALGRDVEGRPVIADLARMPHLLVAGATGSGKSVTINTIESLITAIHRVNCDAVVDPKCRTRCTRLPHPRAPVVTTTRCGGCAQGALYEMTRAY